MERMYLPRKRSSGSWLICPFPSRRKRPERVAIRMSPFSSSQKPRTEEFRPSSGPYTVRLPPSRQTAPISLVPTQSLPLESVNRLTALETPSTASNLRPSKRVRPP